MLKLLTLVMDILPFAVILAVVAAAAAAITPDDVLAQLTTGLLVAHITP